MDIAARIFFDAPSDAAEALILTLEDARVTSKSYTFGSLSITQIMSSGLIIVGDASHLVDAILAIPGASLYVD